MASSYSTDLQLELMVTGENSGTWGDKTNTNLNLLQQAIVGYQEIDVASADVTLAMSQAAISNARNMVLKLTGTLAANRNVNVPDGIEKTYIIVDGTTRAGFSLTIKTVSGTGVAIPAAKSVLVYADGTNVNDVFFLKDVVEDTSPQLGGNLDANGNNILIDNGNFIGDENGLEQIKFATTASAVNELTVTNAATGNAPNVSATGGDTNIDLNLTPKGIGRTTLNGLGKIQATAEKVTTSATASTGTINYDVITQAVLNYTTDATGNFTINLTGENGVTSLDAIMDTGEAQTVAFMSAQGGTAYYNTTVQVDGATVTPVWQGGSAPTGGNINSTDVYTYTAIKTAASTFTVLASQTQFA
jgi:hypothetical protein